MHKSTILWLCLTVICGAFLFQTSQKVTDGRAKLAVLQKEIRTEEESIRVLQAEWSYLNQPERLEKLARQYLGLASMTGKHFAKLADIARAPAKDAESSRVENTPPDNPVPKQKAKPEVKIAKPVAPPKILKPANGRVAAAKKPDIREFNDVMKSLDVQ